MPPTTRRGFIKRAGGAAAALSVPGAAGRVRQHRPRRVQLGVQLRLELRLPSAAPTGPGGLPLARPDHPVTLPIYPDNKAIASGLQPEKGPLQLYNWIEYINQDVVKSFEKKYGVEVQISTFTTIDEAVAKIERAPSSSTCSCPSSSTSSSSSSARCCSRSTSSYIPNLKANVWPSLVNPWYDVGSPLHGAVHDLHHRDRLAHRQAAGLRPGQARQPVDARCGRGPEDLAARSGCSTTSTRASPWACCTTASPTSTPRTRPTSTAAQKAIQQLVSTANLKFDTNEYQHLADGSLWLHQAWSGDMAATPLLRAQGHAADGVRLLVAARTAAGRSTTTRWRSLKGAKNPVLAHLFLNHVLDVKTGVLQLQLHLLPAAAERDDAGGGGQEGLVPPNLHNTLIEEEQFQQRLRPGPAQPRRRQTLWENAWAAVKST